MKIESKFDVGQSVWTVVGRSDVKEKKCGSCGAVDTEVGRTTYGIVPFIIAAIVVRKDGVEYGSASGCYYEEQDIFDTSKSAKRRARLLNELRPKEARQKARYR